MNARKRMLRLVVALWVLLGLGRPALADGLETVKRSGLLRWGADQEGGGPYVFPREDKPDEVTGFEVDLAQKVAEAMRVRAQFTQGQWSSMPDMLRTRKIDVILNGYELVPDRLAVMTATVPYYVYGLQLLVRKDDPDLKGWSDLPRKPGGRTITVGVLTGSAAETAMKERCGANCEVVSYDGNTDAMREVETGKLDATVQDTPIASYYAPRFPKLAAIDKPTGKGYYVIYVGKTELGLVRAVNEALLKLARTGELERIYRHYGIWNEDQQEILALAKSARLLGYEPGPDEAPAPAETASPAEPVDGAADAGAGASRSGAPDAGVVNPTAAPHGPQAVVTSGARKGGWKIVRDYGMILATSAGLTVVLSVLSFPLAMLIGLLVALGRLYGPAWVRLPLGAYVEFLRGTPLMLQLYFVFFFLPDIGINVPAFWTGVIGLAINYSAYESEIYRAGLQAVPQGQMEAALSLGMPRGLALRRIIVPQATRLVIPPVVNDFIALFKDTSVCSVITLIELTKRFSVLSQSTQATIELMLMTAIAYLLMSLPLSLLARRLEVKLGLEARV